MRLRIGEMMNIAYQIEMHAEILERWFSPAKSRREAKRRILSGQCWYWPESEQMELFA